MSASDRIHRWRVGQDNGCSRVVSRRWRLHDWVSLRIGLDHLEPDERRIVILTGLSSGWSAYGHGAVCGPQNCFNLVYHKAEMAGCYDYNFTHRFEAVFERLEPLLATKELK